MMECAASFTVNASFAKTKKLLALFGKELHALEDAQKS
jgi:hypothetical protein